MAESASDTYPEQIPLHWRVQLILLHLAWLMWQVGFRQLPHRLPDSVFQSQLAYWHIRPLMTDMIVFINVFSVPADAALGCHAAIRQSYSGVGSRNKQDNFLLPLIGVEFTWQIAGLSV